MLKRLLGLAVILWGIFALLTASLSHPMTEKNIENWLLLWNSEFKDRTFEPEKLNFQLYHLIQILQSLNHMAFTYMGLTELPPEIKYFQELHSFSVEDNQLTHLPSEIGNLTELERFSAGNNQLMDVPSTIGNLENLELLILGGNRLTSLPPEIGNLQNLEELDLYYNQLTELPPEILQLTNLKRLTIGGNPLGYPEEILYSIDPKIIFAYLREHELGDE